LWLTAPQRTSNRSTKQPKEDKLNSKTSQIRVIKAPKDGEWPEWAKESLIGLTLPVHSKDGSKYLVEFKKALHILRETNPQAVLRIEQDASLSFDRALLEDNEDLALVFQEDEAELVEPVKKIAPARRESETVEIEVDQGCLVGA
jgi:hypothetical protein